MLSITTVVVGWHEWLSKCPSMKKPTNKAINYWIPPQLSKENRTE